MLAVLSSCRFDQMQFIQDKRVKFLSPSDRSTVTLPFTIRWSVRDFRVTGANGEHSSHAGYFALFVDRAPVPPGKSLNWVAHGDHSCLASEHCPDALYLNSHSVFVTSHTSISLTSMADVGTPGSREEHEITLVLVDGSGRRIGESAWYIDVYLARRGV